MAELKTKKPIRKENRFTKKAILNSNLFGTVDKDILATVLDHKRTYTVDELQAAIKKFKGGI
ncbi:hypothetical protein OZX56_05250 [Lactobacillus sp. ESL0684]|uniref:hypothetical protein n=1 Tax=Lactobacillus sp. ESL0684 TaxID=2983213 RepID=UPI0023F8D2EA|nr:hypothetical protein [Lactobacillus sp. ESL0684]WEV42956.1 hypothetical protein OZX56_05250 [Lactobacillus sp. ESL0684]